MEIADTIGGNFYHAGKSTTVMDTSQQPSDTFENMRGSPAAHIYTGIFFIGVGIIGLRLFPANPDIALTSLFGATFVGYGLWMWYFSDD